MKALTPLQADFSGRASLQPLGLVRLTTYSDREAETVDRVFHWATGTLLYDWGATGTPQTFFGFLRDLALPELRMNHVPSAVPFLDADSLILTLTNEEVDGERLWKTLRDVNLHGATVEAATLLVAPEQLLADPWWDLSALAGTEHLIRFRGELVRAGPITEEATDFEFRAPDPRVPWIEALDPVRNDPRDFGKRLPVVVGRARRVPAINYEVGWTTTLAEEITETTTGNVAITDGTGLPASGSFTLQIDAERITASKVDAQTIAISARAIGGTTAAVHKASAILVEILTNSTIALAAHEIPALTALYAVSIFTGLLVRVTTPFTEQLSDTTTIPGETIASVTFTAAEIEALLDSQSAAAAVTQQPEFAGGGDETFRVDLISRVTIDDASTQLPSGVPAGGLSDCDAVIPQSSEGQAIAFSPNNGSDDAGVFWVGAGQIPDQEGARTVQRFRIVVTLDVGPPIGGDTEVWASYRFFGETGHVQLLNWTSGSGLAQGVTVASAWETVFGDPPLSDIVNGDADPGRDGPRLSLYIHDGTGAAASQVTVWASDTRVECELKAEPLTRTDDTAIVAASLGNGLQFYADLEGQGGEPLTGWVTLHDWNSSLEGWGPLSPGPQQVTNGFPAGGPFEGADALHAELVSTFAELGAVNTIPAANWTGRTLRVALQTDAATLAATNTIAFLVQGDNGGISLWEIPTGSVIADTWQQWTADLTTPPDSVIGAAADLTGVVGYGIIFQFAGSQPAGLEFYLDQFEFQGGVGDFYGAATVFQWFIEDFCGLTGQTDAANLGEALSNLGNIELAGNLAGAGETFSEVIQRLGFEARANVVREELPAGPAYLLLTARGDYTYGAPVFAITEWAEIVEETRERLELATRFRAFYALDASQGDTEEAFGQVVRIDPGQSDPGNPSIVELAAAEARFGRTNREPYFARLLQDPGPAANVFGFYAHEGIRDRARVFQLDLPHWEGFALERGDIVELTPPWDSVPLKLRVLRVQHSLAGSSVRVAVVEVE